MAWQMPDSWWDEPVSKTLGYCACGNKGKVLDLDGEPLCWDCYEAIQERRDSINEVRRLRRTYQSAKKRVVC